MTFLFWITVVPAVTWGLFWAVDEVFRAWTGADRHPDITELLERER